MTLRKSLLTASALAFALVSSAALSTAASAAPAATAPGTSKMHTANDGKAAGQKQKTGPSTTATTKKTKN